MFENMEDGVPIPLLTKKPLLVCQMSQAVLPRTVRLTVVARSVAFLCYDTGEVNAA
jgi:hypothetical protein